MSSSLLSKFILGCWTLGLLLLTGCTPAPEPLLRVGSNVWPGYEPLYLAETQNYFAGAPIKMVEYTSASEVIRAYRNRAIEAACLTLDEVLLLLENNLRPRVVLVLDVSTGGDVILGKPFMNKLTDLRGQRVGVENTALGAYMLSRALETVNMKPEEVKIISREIHEHYQAYMNDEVDAVVTFEPIRSRLLAENAKVLFDSRYLPGEIVDVLVVREGFLQKHPDQVKTLLEGWFKALEYMERRSDSAMNIMKDRQGVGAEQLKQAYQGLRLPDREENQRLLTGNPPPLKQTARRLAEVMHRHDLLTDPLDPVGLFDPGPLLSISP